MFPYDLNKRYLVKAPKGAISERGVTAIQQFIKLQNLKNDEWQAKNPDLESRWLTVLPDDWSWLWLVTGRGEYVGTFPKRVSKYYYQTNGIKCPNSFLQELGNIARRHSEDELSYEFDFTDTFNWNDGDFADSRSCFWGGRSEAREWLTDSGALAIRFYEGDKGKARAWLMPIEDNRFVIFNGYGLTTLAIARIFATFIGLSYKKISLDNQGVTDGTLWINDGKGYLVGAADAIATIYAYDFYIGESEMTCDECGNVTNEDDAYYTPDGLPLCDTCFYDICDYCHDCGETHWRDDMTYVESSDRDVCERCLDRRYSWCDACEQYHHEASVTYVDDTCYCEDCLPEHTAICKTCEELHRHDTINEDGICKECQQS